MRLAAIILVVAIVMVAAVFFAQVIRGVGYHDQQVTLKSAKPVKSVSYCFCNVDDELRHLAEDTADPRLFERLETLTPVGERFTATVTITVVSGRLIKTTVHHPRQLVVLADFMDGTRGCRVIDVPVELSEKPMTADFD
jgi:hypothetical protein